ncbi:plasma-membrane choline transporter-domain-containing protein [Gigaspora rosea]|uniref:Protein PNS1 n=1 Tax=Gigaspora rosea TaxID=44941 RepID=A0A397VPK4_9GLOM|nr:plasma-membrane choline transporter-domain-containing protein [Gigaspora rosea]
MSQPYYPPPAPPSQPYYSQPAQQQYYPPQTGYSPVPPPAYEQGSFRGSIAEKWNPKPKFQDLWAFLLFLAHLVGFVVLSYIGLKYLISQRALERNNTFFRPEIIPPFIISGVIGLILSVAYMLFMQRFPLQLIKVTLYLSIAMYFVAALVFFFFARNFILAIIFIIFGILYLIAAFSWRNRIPFAAVMLETVVSITRKYYGIIIMGFIGLVIQVGWSVLWILSLIGAYEYFDPQFCTTTTVSTGSRKSCSLSLYLILVYLVFSFYWTSQVIKTIVHVTASGVYATYYFLEGTNQGTGTTPTLSSFKRATTTSIGSICFGSLIIALLNTARAVLRTFADSDDGACGFLACCIACLLAWIESLVEYFNFYAYVEVAIYGKSYCQAAKDTWTLIKDRGVEAIINDDLIGNVLTMGSLLIGVLCGLLGFLYINFLLKPLLNDQSNTNLIVIFVIICFAIGFMMCVVITDSISSGVSTTFVALAEDPDALRRTKPALFERIRQQWPRVVQGI